MITSPNGSQNGSNVPHRPSHIVIHNRWGQDTFDAIKHTVMQAGIGISFQTRAQAEKDCAAAGTDPDGNNFLGKK